MDTLKKQAIVSAGLTLVFRLETPSGFEKTEFYYENGASDYVASGR